MVSVSDLHGIKEPRQMTDEKHGDSGDEDDGEVGLTLLGRGPMHDASAASTAAATSVSADLDQSGLCCCCPLFLLLPVAVHRGEDMILFINGRHHRHAATAAAVVNGSGLV